MGGAAMPDLSSPLAQPFFSPEGEHAVLLMHGFTGSPAHMRKLGEALHARGFAVRGILLTAPLGAICRDKSYRRLLAQA